MEWDNNNIERMVAYVNNELSKGRTMISIEQEDFGVNERVIHKRVLRKGYKRRDNKYTKAMAFTNPPTLTKEHSEKIIKELNSKNPPPITDKKSNTNKLNDDEIRAIRELLESKDELLQLLAFNKSSIAISNIRSKKNETKSFRVDTGLYEAFKKKANKNNDKITELLNSFMEEYISK